MLPNERRFSRRSPSEAGGRCAIGYAARFNEPADIGEFIESIMPEAFDRALRQRHDVRFLINHDPSLLLARTTNGTLALSRDTVGLRFRAKLPETQAATDLLTLLRSQTMSQCSFGFRVPDGGDTWSKRMHEGKMRDFREIHDCDLLDVSCVTYPAYASTSAGVDDEDEDNGLKSMAAVASRSNTPAEVRSRIAAAVAGRQRIKRGYDQASVAERMAELEAEVGPDYALSQQGRYEHILRTMARDKAEELLKGLD